MVVRVLASNELTTCSFGATNESCGELRFIRPQVINPILPHLTPSSGQVKARANGEAVAKKKADQAARQKEARHTLQPQSRL